MYTTNKRLLFENLSEEQKTKFYEVCKSKKGIEVINRLKNRKQEENIKIVLTKSFPKSKVIARLFSETHFRGKNDLDLRSLGLDKYDIFLVLKKNNLL